MFICSLAATQGTNQKGRKDITGITTRTMLIIPGLHMQKKFSVNYPQFGRHPQEFHPLLIKHKNLKNISFKGCQNIKLSRAPTCLQTSPIHTLSFQFTFILFLGPQNNCIETAEEKTRTKVYDRRRRSLEQDIRCCVLRYFQRPGQSFRERLVTVT